MISPRQVGISPNRNVPTPRKVNSILPSPLLQPRPRLLPLPIVMYQILLYVPCPLRLLCSSFCFDLIV